MKPSLPCLAALLAFGAISASVTHVHAVYFFDDFSDQPVGEFPGSPWTGGSETGGTVVVEQDTDALFGRGTDNRFLRFTADVGDGTVRAQSNDLFEVGEGPDFFQIGFDFIETDDSPFDGNSRFAIRPYAGAGFATDQIGQVDLRELRNDGMYNQGELYRIEWVLNTSETSLNYDFAGDAHTLGSQSSHVWINDTLWDDERGLNLTGTFTGFDLRTFGGNEIEIFVDNVSVVPEPSTYALIFGGLAGVLIWLRRRNRIA